MRFGHGDLATLGIPFIKGNQITQLL
jgi:hypothetical protein